jgi:hypothetical protein
MNDAEDGCRTILFYSLFLGLVNNAAVAYVTPFFDITPEEIDK